VDAVARSAREFPHEIRVDGAEKQIAGFRNGSRARYVIEEPAKLQRAEVGGEGQARLVAKPILATVGCELGDGALDTHILPDDRVVDGAAGATIP
jgi:hypothetical protein